MALAHFHVTKYTTGRAALATGRVHYITRQEEYAPDAKARVLHQGKAAGATHAREDCVEWDHANLPAWAEGSPVRYFSAAETRERMGKAACFEEWRFSLPRELSLPQQQAAAHAFLEGAFGDRHPYVYAIHNPRTVTGTRDQTHCHVIFSRRVNDGIERTEEQWFRKHNRQAPERGGAERSIRFGHRGSVKADRVLYCDTMNVSLAAAQVEARLHPDTLESRGFDRDVEPRAKPSDSNQAKYQGAITERWQDVLTHRMQYAPDKVLEEVQAGLAWDERTAALGITADMDVPAQLERVRMAREYAITHRPAREPAAVLAQRAHELEQDMAKLEQYHARLHVEHRLETMAQAQGRERASVSYERVDRLLAQAHDLGLETAPTPPRQRTPHEPRPPQRTRSRGRARGAGMAIEDEPHGGLDGPDLHDRKRGRDGWEW